MTSSDSDDFEVVDPVDVAQQIAAHKQPEIVKILAWLKPTDFEAKSSEYKRHLASQAPGTGEWIRNTDHFKRWHDFNDHGSIWIKAVPGAGKSVVAASMVDSLASNENVPVLHFFFRQIIETNRSARSLVCDWLAQLLPFSEILQVALWDRLENKENLETTPTKQLWRDLRSALQCMPRVYCVVDALDEMELDEEFLAELNALGSLRPAQIKIIMTSRPKQYLQRLLKDPQVIHVSLEEELVKRDIAIYVENRVAEFRTINQETQQHIRQTVCTRSQGLFLYARLMLDQVIQSTTTSKLNDYSIREMVTKLPIGLREMYNSMLSEYAVQSNVCTDLQVLILEFVTQSARPLRLIELAKALEAGPATIPSESKEIVRNACGPLLEIMEDEVVQILHHSFTEFLLDPSRDSAGRDQFPVVKPATAHCNIALACLRWIDAGAFDDFPDESQETKEDFVFEARSAFDFRSIFLKHPLLEYAVHHWPYHARNCEPDEKLFEILQEFCDPEKAHYRAWTTINKHIERNSTVLHVAAAFGLTSWAKHLIDLGNDVNARDGRESTPLHAAARSGSSEVTQLLIKAGAQVDLDCYDGQKPLHVAASRNHSEIVKLLVAAGVNPLTPKTKDFGRFCGVSSIFIKYGSGKPGRYVTCGHTYQLSRVTLDIYCETYPEA
jgi:hypothetical protein